MEARTGWSMLIACAVLGCLVLALSVGGARAATEPPEYLSSFGPDGTANSNFGNIGSLAVDQQTGAVYVLDFAASSLQKFNAEGQPVSFGGTAPYVSGNRIDGLAQSPRGSEIAVDRSSHVVYVTEEHSLKAFQDNGEPALFTAGSAAGTNEISGFSELDGVAVDVNGDIYASDYPGTVSIYSSSGETITSFGASEPTDLAVAPNGDVYVVDFLGRGTRKFTPSQFPVVSATAYTPGPVFSKPVIDTFSAEGVAVDPVTADVYLAETNFTVSRIGQYDASGTFLRAFGVPGEPGELGDDARGIAVVAGGETFYAGDNVTGAPGGGSSKVEIFGPGEVFVGPPTVENSSARDVTADSATLGARLNPNTLATSYRFEYGFSDCSIAAAACAAVPSGGASIGSGHQVVSVSQRIAGLAPATTYHYRVVAENSAPPVTGGPDRTFTTQALGLGFALGDSRVWEMVSPASKHGGQLASGGLIQADAGGDGLAYLTIGSIETDPDGSRALEAATVLARRGPDGWLSKDISPPNSHQVPFATGHFGEYTLFAPDLSTALLEPRDGTSLSPEASERTQYLRENLKSPVYTPLVTGKEGFANVPSGTEFGGDPFISVGLVRVVGATPNLEHVALKSDVPLVAGALGAPSSSLYLWTGGQLQLVNVLPDAEGGGPVSATLVGSGPGTIRHAISDDGSRVFWGTGNYGNSGNSMTALYMRDITAAKTVRLDVQPGASGSGAPRPAFQGASADGSVVFFLDSQQLTPGASPEGQDLYRCEIPLASPSLGCASLTNLTASPGGSAEVQGLASAVSDDGTHVYFVAKGVLDTTPNEVGDSAVSGEPNLYVWRQGLGVRFVSTLASEDETVWGTAIGVTYLSSATASSSGRFFAFMSQRSLTGYENRDPVSGEPIEEVFRYDAVSDRLDCVSCNPSGASPRGLQVAEQGGSKLNDPLALWEGRWVAATLPEPALYEAAGVSFYRPRSVLDNGRVFFNAVDSLVPGDSNGDWDVYQYEPAGLGGCTASSEGASLARSGRGCVGLISSGTGDQETGFLDASASGDDVFFLSTAGLSVLDEDAVYDVYDARVNGTPAVLRPVPECAGEACQPASAPPNDPTPASEAFSGPGNERRCPKGKRAVKSRGKSRCAPVKHRKHKRRSARAGAKRRAAR